MSGNGAPRIGIHNKVCGKGSEAMPYVVIGNRAHEEFRRNSQARKGITMATKFAFKHEEKAADRSNRVTVTQIDPELVQALEAEWTEILKGIEQGKPAYDLVLPMDSPKTVAITAAHARAWGISRGNGNNDVRRVEVRKLPPRTKGLTPEQVKAEENTLRLSLTKYDPNAPKLGRKAKSNGEAK